jgi:hypothetical protein
MAAYKAYQNLTCKTENPQNKTLNEVNLCPQHLVAPYIIGFRSFMAYSVRAKRLSANTIILSPRALSW